MQTYYENFKRANKQKFDSRVIDPKGLLSGNGHGMQGVYQLSFVNEELGLEIPAYIGQAGVVKNAPSHIASDIHERLLQILKKFLGNYGTYWSGLENNDKFKIKVDVLRIETNHARRLKFEEALISRIKPFLQDSRNGQFDLYPTKTGYSRNDRCISPWTRESETDGQRRVAFLARVDEELQKRKSSC